jgi:hypothetical protein
MLASDHAHPLALDNRAFVLHERLADLTAASAAGLGLPHVGNDDI